MEKKDLKKILVPFILMMIFNLGSYMLSLSDNFGDGYSPHVGLILISGLLFGPYGAVGSVIANGLCDILRGYNIALTITSEIVTFGISYLAYKLWYGNYGRRPTITKPRLDNTYHILLFFGIIIICAVLYSVLQKELFYLFYPETNVLNFEIGIRYFVNFVNSAFSFGVIGILLSKKIDFVHIPKISKRKLNVKFYKVIGLLLFFTTIIVLIIDYYFNPTIPIIIVKSVIISILLYIYITKPIVYPVTEINYTPILERVMNIFLFTTMIILIMSLIVSLNDILLDALDTLLPIDTSNIILYIMILSNILLFIFFFPSIFVLRYVEIKVIKPIYSFSKIEPFIKKGDKIKSDELINIYSDHVDDDDEIGILARSYTDLINNTNEYIENIEKIEGEKRRIEAELDIAKKIQESILPTESIKNDNYAAYGKSRPAKEVGGDFFDYFELDDDNLAIMIGDASGKGIPAALLSTISHAVITQLIKKEKDPSKVLYQLNNQICENNTTFMFITLWIGIYNKKTKILTFSNAGHEPPLINRGNGFEKITMHNNIVLGIEKDFEFVKEEVTSFDRLIAYTDGITDAKNIDGEFYGEKRFIKKLNEISDKHVKMEALIKDIDEFTKGTDQFDDLTILVIDRK